MDAGNSESISSEDFRDSCGAGCDGCVTCVGEWDFRGDAGEIPWISEGGSISSDDEDGLHLVATGGSCESLSTFGNRDGNWDGKAWGAFPPITRLLAAQGGQKPFLSVNYRS
jgi:hypothetical protein